MATAAPPGKVVALVGKKHGALHMPAADFDFESAHAWRTATNLLATVTEHAGRAIALAAPQIGVPIRVVAFAFDCGLGTPRVFVNPVLLTTADAGDRPIDEAEEGCMSLPGRRYRVTRFARTWVEANVLDGHHPEQRTQWECGGLAARAWQHEVDHLRGVLVLERGPEVRQAPPVSIEDAARVRRHFRKQSG